MDRRDLIVHDRALRTGMRLVRRLLVPLLSLLVAVPLVGQESEAGAGVTDGLVATGATLFAGDGGCAVCHGKDAKGVTGMTRDLTDGEWWFVKDGELDAIAVVIKEGLSSTQTGGMPMPGRSNLSAVQIRALADYVLSLAP